jgi:hypothetical protein
LAHVKGIRQQPFNNPWHKANDIPRTPGVLQHEWPCFPQVHVSAAAVVPSLSGAVRTAAERTVLLTFAPRMAVVSLSG